MSGHSSEFAPPTERDDGFVRCVFCEAILPPGSVIGDGRTPLNRIAEDQATEVERIWPTPEGQDPVLRQVAALTEEVGEIARAVLKRSHASRSATGVHKGLSVDEWTEEVALEIGQALGVLLGLGHQEAVDLDGRMTTTLRALADRPSILATGDPDRDLRRGR